MSDNQQVERLQEYERKVLDKQRNNDDEKNKGRLPDQQNRMKDQERRS
ncbi:hypothetical protein [Bacillus massiliglaciei]|nr:hypothetical protein [Bacillus massiliglaciei]